ncbi:MAG: PAS domain S-box protein [Ignavibacteria bacterium]
MKKAQEKIAENTRKINTLVNNLPGVVYRCKNDSNWSMEYLSNGVLELTGFPPEDFIFNKVRTFNSIIEPDDQQSIREKVNKSLSENKPYSLEYRIRNSNGDYKWVKDRGCGISENGKLVALEGYIYDITEQVSASRSLIESEEILRTFINAIPEPAFLIDKNYKILICNNSLAFGFNMTQDDIMGKNIFELLSKNDAGCRIEYFKEVFEKGTPKVFEDSRNDSCYINYYYPVFNEKKEVSKIAIFALDITGRLKAERENILLAQTLKSIKDAISITDMNNNILFVNNAFLETYGYIKDEVIGKNINFFASGKNTEDTITKMLNETIEENWNGELINLRKDGTEFPIELWKSVVKDAYNNNIAMVCVARDITERKREEKEIEEANKKLVRAQKVARIGSWEILFPSNVRYWSDNMYEIMGFPKNIKVDLKELEKRIVPGELERFKIALDETINTGKPYSMDYKIIMSDGTAKYIHDEGEIIRDKYGAVITMFGTTQDITKNKFAEIALKESEEKYRTIFDNAPIGMFHSTKEGKMIHSNLGFAEMMGYKSVDELMKGINRSSIADAFYFEPEKRAILIKEVIQSGNWKTYENQFRKKDGNIMTGVLTIRSFPNIINNNIELEGFITDISKRKIIEENLRKSEERFKQVAENADEWIWEVNTDGLYTYANPVVEKILGYDPEEITNKKYFYDFLLPEKKDETKKATLEIFSRKEKIKSLINKNIHKNGKVVILETNGVPVLDDKNNLLGYRGVDKDITERKSAEEELIKAKEKAEEMNKIKTNFLANMSHEVRTPLVAILGFSEILSEIVKEEELKNYVDMIHKGGERLLDTLNLILDLSLIEAQKMKIDLTPLDIVKEVKEVVKLFEKTAEKKKLRIEILCDVDSIVLDLDVKILRQVMNNLINNAIKYTNAGGIKVNINEEKKNDKNYVAVRIEDTGIGIPENKHNLIWEEFRQASEGFNRSFEGAGLGLSITKKFVEKLSGKIFLEKSIVDIGSVFTVLFPLEGKFNSIDTLCEKDTGIDKFVNPTDKELPGVLYVEDDHIAIDIVKAYIKNYCTIDSALSGMEGIQKAKNKLYDAILMDINLGKEMNGLEATKTIREIPGYKNVPIIAVTAFAMVGDKDEFFEKGCTHYISKPFTKEELRELISEVLKIN